MAVEAVRSGQVLFAVSLVMSVLGYIRPSALLSIRRRQIVAPGGGQRHWTVLLHPSDQQEISKTGTSDDSIVMDTPGFAWLNVILEKLVRGNCLEKVFPWRYDQSLYMFRQTAKKVGQ